MQVRRWLARCLAILGAVVLSSCSSGNGSTEQAGTELTTTTAELDSTALAARPLSVPSIGSGQPCPLTQDITVVSADLGPMAGTGPGRLVGIQIGQPLDVFGPYDGWFEAKMLWALKADWSGPVLVRGWQLDGGGRVRFANNTTPPTDHLLLEPDAAAAVLKAGVTTKLLDGGWYGLPGTALFEATGCVAIQVDCAAGTSVVVFRTSAAQPNG